MLVLTSILTFDAVETSRARLMLTETPGFPVQSALALAVGFLLWHRRREPIMQWVWVLPLVVTCIAVTGGDLPMRDRISHYFGNGCQPKFRCFDQFATTLLLYTSACYSISAFMGRKLDEKR